MSEMEEVAPDDQKSADVSPLLSFLIVHTPEDPHWRRVRGILVQSPSRPWLYNYLHVADRALKHMCAE